MKDREEDDLEEDEQDEAEYTQGTLCWRCGRRVDECTWLQYNLPVPGWKTKPGRNGQSGHYSIRKCPRFIPSELVKKGEKI